MKRSGRILVFLLTLALLGANCLYGIEWKFPSRKQITRRNRARVIVHGYDWPLKRPARMFPLRSVKRPTSYEIARAKQDLIRPRTRVKEYILSTQEQDFLSAANLRIQRMIARHVRPRIKMYNPSRLFPSKAEIDAVIFDLDGTLLDSLWAWEESRKESTDVLGFAIPDELSRQLEAMSLDEGAALIKEIYNLSESTEEILDRKLAPIRTHYAQDIQAMPGIPERLARLKEQGIKMAVATASRKEFAELALTRLGLRDYFEFIISCDDVKVGKTSPKVYEVARERLGTMKERTLVAEDALHALETAHKAGFPTAAIEEPHSLEQTSQKLDIADYYVISYEGKNTLAR